MKTPDWHRKGAGTRPAAGRTEEARREPSRDGAAGGVERVIDGSPRVVTQRKRLEAAFGPAVQRVEDEDLMQGRFDPIQRVEDEEELPVQGRFDPVQRVEEEELLQGRAAGGALQRVEEASTSGGLPEGLRAGVEAASGMDLSDVRVHRNSPEPGKVQALAYAQGNDIHLGPGQEGHLPHEAWHVVQQRQGRVEPTLELPGGVAVNDDQTLESEADRMGEKASRG